MSTLDNIPTWCEDLSEWVNYITNAHGKAVNIPTVGNTGEGVHIGIIDTVRELPEDYTACDIAYEESVLQGVNEKWTTEHGIEVFNFISSFAPSATFSFIQASKSDHSISVRAFYEAIQKAISLDIDILNISADDCSTGPVQSNPYAKYTQLALDEEIIVVGAAGNWYENRDRPPIGCPAAMDEVVGVGGFVTKCPCGPNEGDEEEKHRGPYYALKRESEEYHGLVPEDTFCGQSQCYDGNDCITNSMEEEWDRNSLATNGGPDVLAPVHYPRVNSNGIPYLIAGTSYSAPIVTAALALGYEGCISEVGREPNHYHAMEAVRQSSAPINHGDHRKLHATKLLTGLKSIVNQ